MRFVVYYWCSLLCFLLLVYTYTIDVANLPIFEIPEENPIEDGLSGMLLIKGAIEADGRKFDAYEFAHGGSHFAGDANMESLSMGSVIDFIKPNLEFTTFAETPELNSSSLLVLRNEGPLFALDQPEWSACENVDHLRYYVENSVVLVRHEQSCGFVEQIRNLESAGAVGVVMAGDFLGKHSTMSRFSSSSSSTNSASTNSTGILGFIVSPNDFVELSALAAKGTMAKLLTLNLSLGLPFLEFLLVLISRPLLTVGVLFAFLKGNRELKKRKQRAKPATVAVLPTHCWSSQEHDPFNQDECSICLENYDEGCEVRVLPCRHIFHKQCISTWLLRERSVCPLCLHDINESV